MTNDWRKQLDVQLKELALKAQQHPYATKEQRVALTRLMNAIWQSGRLIHPYKDQFQLFYEDIYDEAVQNLFFYLCQDNNIKKYDPERGEVITWVNMLLSKRFFPEAIPKVIGKGNEINLEDSHLENLPSSQSQPMSLSEQIIECIESDPELIFCKEHIKGHPEANFQAIATRRCSGISWKEISAEWGIGIYNFYYTVYAKLRTGSDVTQRSWVRAGLDTIDTKGLNIYSPTIACVSISSDVAIFAWDSNNKARRSIDGDVATITHQLGFPLQWY